MTQSGGAGSYWIPQRTSRARSTPAAGHQMQRHVDSHGDAGRGNHICIVYEPLVGADLDSRVKLGKRLQ